VTSFAHRGAVLAVGSLLALGLTACGEEELPEGAGDLPEVTDALPSEAQESAEAIANEVFGDDCGDIPETGAGSAAEMAQQPVSEALADVPQLSTLADALAAADLAGALDAQDGITVLAPTDAAFQNIPVADLQALLADPAQLGGILQYHVITEQLTPDELAGEQDTLAGQPVTIEGSGEDFTVPAESTVGGETPATVTCGNITTENAVVYIIDGVLQPAA
jgi:uncharacterized surface protein with fasciclin (FAS1) repeats